MTTRGSSRASASFSVEPEEGYTEGNADYMRNRYTERRFVRAESTEHGEVKLWIARDDHTGEDVLLKEHPEPTLQRGDAEHAALKAIQSLKVVKLIKIVRTKEPRDRKAAPGLSDLENKMYLVFEHQPPKVEVQSEREVWNVLTQVTQAVKAAHRANLVLGGGIKRESLFGDSECVLLGNFSTAKPMGENENAEAYPGQDVRDIWKLGSEMFAALGQKPLSDRARGFIDKANKGGGATFLHLHWEFFLATGTWSDPTDAPRREPYFIKPKF